MTDHEKILKYLLGISSRISGVNKQISDVKSDVKKIKSDVSSIINSANKLKKTTDDGNRILKKTVDGRIDTLTNKIDTLTNKLEKLQHDVKNAPEPLTRFVTRSKWIEIDGQGKYWKAVPITSTGPMLIEIYVIQNQGVVGVSTSRKHWVWDNEETHFLSVGVGANQKALVVYGASSLFGYGSRTEITYTVRTTPSANLKIHKSITITDA